MVDPLLALLAHGPNFSVPHRPVGPIGLADMAVPVGLIVVFVVIPLARYQLAERRRSRTSDLLHALPRRPAPDARCLLVAKVASGDVEPHPMTGVPAVCFDVTVTTHNPPPGEPEVEPLRIVHRGRCALECDGAIFDVDTRRVEVWPTDGAPGEVMPVNKVPAPVRATLEARGVRELWSTGRRVEVLVRASSIRVGDTLTVLGVTKPRTESAPAATAKPDGAGYREGPGREQLPVWTLASGPSPEGKPILSARAPDDLVADLAERQGASPWVDV